MVGERAADIAGVGEEFCTLSVDAISASAIFCLEWSALDHLHHMFAHNHTQLSVGWPPWLHRLYARIGSLYRCSLRTTAPAHDLSLRICVSWLV